MRHNTATLSTTAEVLAWAGGQSLITAAGTWSSCTEVTVGFRPNAAGTFVQIGTVTEASPSTELLIPRGQVQLTPVGGDGATALTVTLAK